MTDINLKLYDRILISLKASIHSKGLIFDCIFGAQSLMTSFDDDHSRINRKLPKDFYKILNNLDKLENSSNKLDYLAKRIFNRFDNESGGFLNPILAGEITNYYYKLYIYKKLYKNTKS